MSSCNAVLREDTKNRSVADYPSSMPMNLLKSLHPSCPAKTSKEPVHLLTLLVNMLGASELKSPCGSYTLRTEKGGNVLNLVYNLLGTHQAQPEYRSTDYVIQKK